MNNLIAKGKKVFITGTLPKPAIGEVDYKLWVKNYVMIKACIKKSISPKLQWGFAFAHTSKALWDSVKDKYDQKK